MLLHAVRTMLFPHRCACCGALADAPLCARCAPLLRLQSLEPVEGVSARLSLGTMQGPLRGALLQLKYGGEAWRAEALGAHAGSQRWPRDLARGIGAVLPVPLSSRRFRSRGFNQAELLARGIAQALSLPLDVQTLARVRHAEAQARKDRQSRQGILGAYRCTRTPPRTVLLVDDVTTTGATFRACATALRAAGCRRIVAFAFASVDPGYAIWDGAAS